MKLSDWFRARSLQEILMIVVIVLLLSMIATRWRYIGDTVSEAFRRRFVPPQEVPSQETPIQLIISRKVACCLFRDELTDISVTDRVFYRQSAVIFRPLFRRHFG